MIWLSDLHRPVAKRATPAIGSRDLSGEAGVSTLEYVGITAIALILAAVIIAYLQSDGLPRMGEKVAELIDGTVDAFKAADAARFR